MSVSLVSFCASSSRPSATYATVKSLNDNDELLTASKFLEQGLNEAAIDLATKIISKQPECEAAYRILALAYQNTGRTDRAIETINRLIKFEPNNAENYFILGMLYFIKCNYGKCIINYEQAIKLAPAVAKYKEELSRAYFEMGLNLYSTFQCGQEVWAKLIDYFSKAIQANQRNADAHWMLGVVNEEIGDVWEAQGNKNEGLKRFGIAKKEYLKAHELTPDGKYSFYLARAYLKLGEFKLALMYINLYCQNFPSDIEGKKLQDQIKTITQ